MVYRVEVSPSYNEGGMFYLINDLKKRKVTYTPENNHISHPKALLKMMFLFAKVGYISSLEGSWWLSLFLHLA